MFIAVMLIFVERRGPTVHDQDNFYIIFHTVSFSRSSLLYKRQIFDAILTHVGNTPAAQATFLVIDFCRNHILWNHISRSILTEDEMWFHNVTKLG